MILASALALALASYVEVRCPGLQYLSPSLISRNVDLLRYLIACTGLVLEAKATSGFRHLDWSSTSWTLLGLVSVQQVGPERFYT